MYRTTLGLLLLFALLLPVQAVSATVYQCHIDGMTHYTKIPCDPNDLNKGIYQPKSKIVIYTPGEDKPGNPFVAAATNKPASTENTHLSLNGHTTQNTHNTHNTQNPQYAQNTQSDQDVESAGEAIIIKQQRCEGDEYSVVLKNISQHSTYATTVDVTFNYGKPGSKKKAWDKRQQTLVLKPHEEREWVLEGKEAPSAFDMECEANRTVKLVSSTRVRW